MTHSQARSETIKYHEDYYGKYSLFEKGSWLEKPDPLSMELVAQLKDSQQTKILDLGCGIGRNSIPIAKFLQQDSAEITCVDFLETAITKLLLNAQLYGVEKQIVGIQSDFENFEFQPDSYNLVLAVSVLEHCNSYEGMLNVIDKIITGTANGGYNRLEFTTNRNIRDLKTNEQLPTSVETALESHTLSSMLKDKYKSWSLINLELTPYEEVLDRDGKKILWRSTQVNMVAQKQC